ncbi:MAG TPA: M18 family aminopeptidase [Ilumatobacteraceae bacterium]|nr:M18 family aminopeptidase [Ilumatobacteraceae bacterium]
MSRPAINPLNDDLIAFLDASPSPWHAVASTVDRLVGFERLDEADAWDQVPAAGYVVRGGAIIAWKLPGDLSGGHPGPHAPFRLVGAHTDSPCLRVKPHPDAGGSGWKQLAVEVYGGILNNSWLDRDLGVAGRVVGIDGTTTLVNVAEPVARVPQLAVHLDREVNSAGLVLDTQQHLSPVWGVGTASIGEFAEWIGEAAGIDAAPTWWELCLYDVQGASVLGADRSLLASGRLDNQLSCWAAVRALVDADPVDHVAVIVLNDHEEVGSASATGAAGPFLHTVLSRLVSARGGSHDDLHRSFATSACISADNAHAVHPNYPERHEPGHRPVVNAGPAIKVNSNQRYATSAETAAVFQRACERAGVPWQVFVSRNNMPCGSTIGPVTSTRLGIATVDIGVPQLSMHSARELCGADDPGHLMAAMTEFLSAAR